MSRAARRAPALPTWLGPALIMAVVLVDLRGFVVASRLTNEHFDLLSFWLPRWSFLGRAVADLTLPTWNPYEMLGYRFAADPQSGWLYAPPMLLFSTLPPAVAMRAMLVLHPLLGGLGLYSFLRIDGVGRFGATLGGMSLAAMMSTSELVLSMPFAGTVAWTTVVLVAAAAFRRAERTSSRIAWLALGAFAWSQVANAHLSHGLLACSLLVTAYLLAHSLIDVARGTARRRVIVRAAMFLVALPLASLAILVPRVDTIQSSSLGEGYAALEAGTGERVAVGDSAIQDDGVWAAWPLASSSAPGAYAGAAVLLAAPLAFRARWFRATTVAMVAVVAAIWLFTLTEVVTGPIGRLFERLPFGDTLVHNPGRMRIVWLIALPTFAAAGIQGLIDDPPPRSVLRRWLAAGVVVWLAVPLVAGGLPIHWLLFAVALVPAVILVRALADGRRWAAGGIVALLALEVAIGSVWASRYEGFTMRIGLEGDSSAANAVLQPLQDPDVDLDAFLVEGPFVRIIGDDRYLAWAPPAAYLQRGYLTAQEPTDWPSLTLERGTLFGIRDVLGYNPVQLRRYWTWIRRTNGLALFYNATSVQYPTERDVALMGIRYLIVPEGVPSPLPGEVVATDRGYDLVDLAAPGEIVSVVPRWVVVDDVDAAFDAVFADEGVAAGTTAILETDPGLVPTPGGSGGSATYAEPAPTEVRLTVDASAPSIVVVRTSFDDGWTATVDGEAAPVFPTDGFLQGIPVDAGQHDVRLVYRDAAVATGLWLSAVVWSLLTAAWVGARIGERRPARRRQVPTAGTDADEPARVEV